jgi:hypothetical protein
MHQRLWQQISQQTPSKMGIRWVSNRHGRTSLLSFSGRIFFVFLFFLLAWGGGAVLGVPATDVSHLTPMMALTGESA